MCNGGIDMVSTESAKTAEKTAGSSNKPVIVDTPARYIHDTGDLVQALMALLVGAIAVLSALYLHGFSSGMEADVRQAAGVLTWTKNIPMEFIQRFVSVSVISVVFLNLFINREWSQALSSAVAIMFSSSIIEIISGFITNSNNDSLTDALSSGNTNAGGAYTIIPGIYAIVSAFLIAAGPRRKRKSVERGWNIFFAMSSLMVIVSASSLIGTVLSVSIGICAGSALRYAVGTYNLGARGEKIAIAAKNVGIKPKSLVRRESVAEYVRNLADDFATGSRIYDLEDTDSNHYVVSVVDPQSRYSEYLRQIWSSIRFIGIQQRRDSDLRSAVQHHMTALFGLRSMNLPCLHPYAMAEADESALLIFRTNHSLSKVDWKKIGDSDVINALKYLQTANNRGYTHRRITPECFAIAEDGSLVLAGWENADCGSNPAAVNVDRFQMLIALSTVIGTVRTVDCAREAWGDETVSALIPYMQPAVIPSETKQHKKYTKKTVKQLRETVSALLADDDEETPENVTLSRFNFKSFLGAILLIAAVAVIATQLNIDDIAEALKQAKPLFVVLSFALGILSCAGTNITLLAFIPKPLRKPGLGFVSQLAQAFASVTMPAGVGPAFVNLQFLRKSGLKNAAASAAMSAIVAAQFATTALFLIIIGIFTGKNALDGMIPEGTSLIIIGIATAAIAGAMAITPLRKFLFKKLGPIVIPYMKQLTEQLTEPRSMTMGALGAIIQNVFMGLSFWTALMAFDCRMNPFETMFLYLIANTAGAAVPTPGGLGGIEAALTFVFASAGVPNTAALSATLVFRVCTYWLRIPIGALAMKRLSKKNMI